MVNQNISTLVEKPSKIKQAHFIFNSLGYGIILGAVIALNATFTDRINIKQEQKEYLQIVNKG